MTCERKLRFWTRIVCGSPSHCPSRSELARIAILKHYGFTTSFLDVTSSVDIAAHFALWKATDPTVTPLQRSPES